jgi:hypothetical protein
MINLQQPQLAGPMVNVIPFDKIGRKSRHNSLLARCLGGLLRALHESRRHQSERVIRRYRHLTCVSEMPDVPHSDAESGRR